MGGLGECMTLHAQDPSRARLSAAKSRTRVVSYVRRAQRDNPSPVSTKFTGPFGTCRPLLIFSGRVPKGLITRLVD